MSALADVLAKHRWYSRPGRPFERGVFGCSCTYDVEFPTLSEHENHVAEAVSASGLAVVPAGVVDEFIGERAQFITAIQNCASDNTADYWRWQGHAEARRHLSERLASAEQVLSR